MMMAVMPRMIRSGIGEKRKGRASFFFFWKNARVGGEWMDEGMNEWMKEMKEMNVNEMNGMNDMSGMDEKHEIKWNEMKWMKYLIEMNEMYEIHEMNDVRNNKNKSLFGVSRWGHYKWLFIITEP